jgi:upstream activation factor subunit UAF30
MGSSSIAQIGFLVVAFIPPSTMLSCYRLVYFATSCCIPDGCPKQATRKNPTFGLASGRDAQDAKSGLDEPKRVSSSVFLHPHHSNLFHLSQGITLSHEQPQASANIQHSNQAREKESAYLLLILICGGNMIPRDLEPAIRKVLTAPGVDLNQISAKAVRKRLQAMDPSLTYEWMKENREAIDGIIGEIFQSVNEAVSVSGSGDTNGVHEDADVEDAAGEDGEGEEELESSPKRPAKKRQKKNGQEKADAEYARQLSNELNSRSRSSRNTVGKPKTKASKKGGSGKKRKPLTAATVDSGEDGSDADSTVGKKRKARGGSGGGAKGGFSKEYNLRYGFRRYAVREITLNPTPIAASLWPRCSGSRGFPVLRP